MEEQISKLLNELNELNDLPSISSTKLVDQIKFMELSNKFYTNPMSISILNSLIELKGIKESRIPKP
jgi:hypothetical protein